MYYENDLMENFLKINNHKLVDNNYEVILFDKLDKKQYHFDKITIKLMDIAKQVQRNNKKHKQEMELLEEKDKYKRRKLVSAIYIKDNLGE